MRISDWSSDVCSSDLRFDLKRVDIGLVKRRRLRRCGKWKQYVTAAALCEHIHHVRHDEIMAAHRAVARHLDFAFELAVRVEYPQTRIAVDEIGERSEEHTSELQSLMSISYAAFCLKQQTNR